MILFSYSASHFQKDGWSILTIEAATVCKYIFLLATTMEILKK